MKKFVWAEDKAKGFAEDRLERANIAKFLTTYLVSEGQKRNYVLNVNAEWGAGKTYFLERWKDSIEKDHPVVYIDAWQQDYSDDPLLTVVSSIIDQLQGQHGSQGDVAIRKASRGLLGLLKVATPAITKAVIKKVSGVDTDELADKLKEENTGDMVDSKIAGELMKSLLDNHSSKKEAIANFKKAIKDWANKVEKTTKKKPPVFIFIDELDRCRPSYAIEMLEVIKHLFDMKGVVFVVATDTDQLQHAIKVIYGAEFDASTYLGRFFNRRITLKCGEIRDYVQNLPQFESLKTLVINQEGFWPCKLEFEDLLTQVCIPMENYELDLRTSDRIVDRLLAILENSTENMLQIDILFLMTLLCMNEKDHVFYSALANNKINANTLDGHWWKEYPSKYIDSDQFIKRPKFILKLSYNWQGLFNRHDSKNNEENVPTFRIFSQRLQCFEDLQQWKKDHHQQKDYMYQIKDFDEMLFISFVDHPDNRSLAIQADYFNWVDLACTFDE